MIGRAVRAVAALEMTAVLLLASAAAGHSVDGQGMSVSLVTTPGYAGHAFVYAQVTDSISAYPAPTGLSHQSPYYAKWLRQPYGSASCPWLWTVYVFDRATNQQINTPPPGAPPSNLGTTTSRCASPQVTPVELPPLDEASARLDLDLAVSLAPARPILRSPAVLSAALSGAMTQDLNLYLNMAIEGWSVSRWTIDFGDGSTAAFAGTSANQLSAPHTYTSPGTFDARVLAVITGDAQAARYDRYGSVRLVREPFSVEVANDTSATPRIQPVKTYLPPLAYVTVAPAIAGTLAGSNSFQRVDVLRGALTEFTIHLVITREGLVRVGGALAGTARSRLLRWQYTGAGSDAPAIAGTRPGEIGDATGPLRLQWNEPDKVLPDGLQDYVVPIRLYLETHFSDGHLATYAIDSSFSATVDFAAESG